jgi:FtsH-binding integral membrane protein
MKELQLVAVVLTAMMAWALMMMLPPKVKRDSAVNRSRWLMASGLLLLCIQFLLQYIFGFRQRGIAEAVMLNLALLIPTSALLALSIFNLQRQGELSWMHKWIGVLTWGAAMVIIGIGLLTGHETQIQDTRRILWTEMAASCVFGLMQLYYAKNIITELKRMKRFLMILCIANFGLIAFCLPDTFMPMLGLPSVSTSGFGAAVCTIVVWYGATQLNSFDIRMGNITEKLFEFIDAGIIVFNTDREMVMENRYSRQFLDSTKDGAESITDIFDVDEPLCYDIYNRKIRYDRICMTVTPPEHNVIRIIEPMQNGEERFRKLSLDEHFRLMGFHMDGINNEILFPPTQNYTKLGRRAGNGWDVNLVGILLNHIFFQLL